MVAGTKIGGSDNKKLANAVKLKFRVRYVSKCK